jgi:hypothetical protein
MDCPWPTGTLTSAITAMAHLRACMPFWRMLSALSALSLYHLTRLLVGGERRGNTKVRVWEDFGVPHRIQRRQLSHLSLPLQLHPDGGGLDWRGAYSGDSLL